MSGGQRDQARGLDARLARLETGVASLSREVESLARSVGDLIKREGKPNYTAWGVAISAIAVIGGIASMAVFGPINALEQISAERTATSIRDRERLGDRLDQAIRDEQARNNMYGERIGRAEAVYDLIRAGKLRME